MPHRGREEVYASELMSEIVGKLDSRIRLRPSTMDDLDFLEVLYSESMSRYLEAHSEWDPSLFRKRFIPEHYRVVLLDETRVGQLKVFTEISELFLADIQISVNYRKQGIGCALITSVLEEAANSERSVRLRVLKGNPAIRLYERLKFEVYGETASEYLMRAWPGESASSPNQFVPFTSNKHRVRATPELSPDSVSESASYRDAEIPIASSNQHGHPQISD